MNEAYSTALHSLSAAGWAVELGERCALPAAIRARYGWLPESHVRFLEETRSVVSADGQAWFVTALDLSKLSDSAFAWNEWELQSLEAAGGATAMLRGIVNFWDRHFPLVHTVEDGYGYFALGNPELHVVQGGEPEFEQPDIVANTIQVFFEHLTAAGSNRIAQSFRKHARGAI